MFWLRTHPRIALLMALFLAALVAAIVYALLEERQAVLTISFLDVGQGDAVLIESPDGVEMLVDGGRDRSVLRELPRVIGPLDRSIDVVVATHPDADHIGGLPDVLYRYRVAHYLESGVDRDTSQSERLQNALTHEKNVDVQIARRGMRIHLGTDVYADVLYPDRDVSKEEANAGSIVMRVVYGETSILLTGDAPDEIEAHLMAQGSVDSDLLKAGHHGSRTSTSAAWLRAVSPETVVISAGKDNAYGHPHAEVVVRVQSAGIELVSTAEEGTLTFISDGVHIVRK